MFKMYQILLLFSSFLFVISCYVVHGQNFDPNLDDKFFLDQIEMDVLAEVNETKIELIHQAKYTQDVARVYAGVKIKENLFKALRVLAEKEKENMRQYKKDQENKQSKQEDEEDGEDGEGSTRRPNNILPVIGNLVKALFGGNSINLTAYVDSATRFLPSPIQQQIVGVVKIIAHNPSRTTTLPPTTIITILNGTDDSQTTNLNGTQVPIRVDTVDPKNPNATLPTPTRRTTTEEPETAGSSSGGGSEEEEEEGEDSRRKSSEVIERQLNLPSLTSSLNFLGALFGGMNPTRAPVVNTRRGASPRPAAATNTTESASGFDEQEREDPSQQFSLEGLANSVRNGVGDMIRIAPDLFKGAREAVNLISGLSNFIGALDL